MRSGLTGGSVGRRVLHAVSMLAESKHCCNEQGRLFYHQGRCVSVAGEEGGGTNLLLALVIIPLTTHTYRRGAPFLLLTQTPPTVGCPLRVALQY